MVEAVLLVFLLRESSYFQLFVEILLDVYAPSAYAGVNPAPDGRIVSLRREGLRSVTEQLTWASHSQRMDSPTATHRMGVRMWHSHEFLSG
jgi:hypothetical protein